MWPPVLLRVATDIAANNNAGVFAVDGGSASYEVLRSGREMVLQREGGGAATTWR
jgi:hypothetical protein